MYNIHGLDHVTRRPIASFDSESGFRLIDPRSLPERRKDFQGAQFRAYTAVWYPYVIEVEEVKQAGNNKTIYRPKGLYIEMMDVLTATLNFTVEYVPKPGKPWASMIMGLNKQDAPEMAVTGFSQSVNRFKLVKFSHYLLQTTLGMSYLIKPTTIGWEGYLSTFLTPTWVAIIVGAFMSVAAISIILFVSKQGSYLTPLAVVGLCLISKSPPSVKKQNLSFKIALVVLSFSGFVIISLYRAMLSASLAIAKDQPPVADLSQILGSHYKLLVPKGTSLQSYLEDSPPGSTEKGIMENHVIYTGSSLESLELMLNESVTPHSLAFGVKQSVSLNRIWPCNFHFVNRDYRKRGNGIAFRKDWPCADVINHHMLKLKEMGFISRLFRSFKDRQNPICSLSDPSQASFTKTLVVYTILLTGLGIAAVVFCCEKIWQKWFKNTRLT